MSSDNTNEDAKSKIEKIRIDLERKLAALEAEKLKTTENHNVASKSLLVEDKPIIDNKNFIKEISNLEKRSSFEGNIAKEETFEEETFFEINDIIENVASKEIVSETELEETKLEVNTVKEEETVKEEVETIEKKVTPIIVPLTSPNKTKLNKEEQNKTASKKDNNLKDKETVEKKEQPVLTAVPIIINSKKEVSKEKIIIPTEIIKKEEPKKSKLNYIIYLLGLVVFLGLIYLFWNLYSNNQKNNTNENSLLSEYENRRYKDSIELADANNRILNFESQRYIDSIANTLEITLNNSKTSNTTSSQNRVQSQEKKSIFSDNVTSIFKPKTTKNKTNVINNQDKVISKPIKDSSIETNKKLENTNERIEKEELNTNSLNKTTKKEESIEGESKKNGVEDNIKDNSVESKKPIVKESEREVKKESKKIKTLTTIDKSPIYPGCEDKSTELLKKKCLMSSISKYVARKFNGDLAQDLGLEGGRKKINVSFLIDKLGNVTVLKVRAQHKVLEKEALRIVNSLPKMKPGKSNGKAEPVLYNLPIVYKIEY